MAKLAVNLAIAGVDAGGTDALITPLCIESDRAAPQDGQRVCIHRFAQSPAIGLISASRAPGRNNGPKRRVPASSAIPRMALPARPIWHYIRNWPFPIGVRMRAAACLVSLALVAGCSGEDGLPPLPTDQVRARFPPGGIADAIEIDAVDRLPLRRAELVAPDGEATAASYLQVDSSPSVAFQHRFVDSPYAGNAFGMANIAPDTPFSGDIGGAPQGRARLLAISSTASIPLIDEVAYRRDWRSYRIFLSFGDLPGEVERRVLPAPEPPPKE